MTYLFSVFNNLNQTLLCINKRFVTGVHPKKIDETYENYYSNTIAVSFGKSICFS